jgi:hypothetical protein
MASHTRKTLQIKRPEATTFKPGEKKPLPQVSITDSAATSQLDTDQLGVVGPKTARLRQPDPNSYGAESKGQTTRIALPDEDKLRKARRADATSLPDDALPKAAQVENAQNSATMPIMIDTEEVQSSRTKLPAGDTGDNSDQTMQIDPSALQMGEVTQVLPEEEGNSEGNDRTMRIDPSALQTADVGKALAAAVREEPGSDATMKIDPASLQTADVGKVLDKIASEKPNSDATMKIDAEALKTGVLDKIMPEDIMAMETMKIEPIPEPVRPTAAARESFNAATIAIPAPEAEAPKPEQAYNAQTMALDSEQLAAELSKGDTRKQNDDANLDETMDLTSERPKTILIKRPSRDAASAPSQPTVKTVRPDAVTVRTARPVTAVPGQAKEGTSRVDVPAMPGTTEGKTIKLRRPGGANTSRPGAPLSRVTAGAGLHMNADGSVTSTLNPTPAFGGGSLALVLLTFFIAAGAIWVVASVPNRELPMPGRLVSPANELISP